VQIFDETIDPQDCPTLASKQTHVESDNDVTPALHKIVKLAKDAVKSTDLQKVLHVNDRTARVVVVPCSAKQSGFKMQAQKSQQVHQILQRARRCKEEEVAQEGNDDKEFACANDDTARWLIAHLGDCDPSKFVRLAQALDMPIHKGNWTWSTPQPQSDAGVGVAAQRIIMKHFVCLFWMQFAVPVRQRSTICWHHIQCCQLLLLQQSLWTRL
jgi:hypothetical protein